MVPVHISREQCIVTDRVCYSGASPGIFVDGFDSGIVKDSGTVGAGYFNPVANILGCLFECQRRQVVADGNALAQLPQIRALQPLF